MLGGIQKLPPKALFALGGYMVCSSLLLLTNKLAVSFLPAPSFVLLAQMAACALIVFACGVVGLVEVEPLQMKKLTAFMPASLCFTGLIYANIKTLQYANVETFIVFRASTPVLLCVADYLFLGRELPNLKSTISICVLVLGAFCYVYTDAGFHVTGYTWLGVWYLIFLFDQLYLKHVANTVKMSSNWGRVYYSNFLSSFPLLFIFLMNGDSEKVAATDLTFRNYGFFFLGIALGVSMSYFAWSARSQVSATYFSVVGNVCKFVTIILNFLIWDKHATPVGMFCLFCCLGAAYFYEQAPMRTDAKDEQGSVV